jgi:hypothetical protein
MKIQLTSFIDGLSNKVRLDLTASIINNSKADILLFSGHTIYYGNAIEKLKSNIENNKTEVFFELENIKSKKVGNCLYHIKKGKINNLYTNQLFAQSGEIENNYELADRLLNELETKRKFKVKGLFFLIMQCGEINILKNLQRDNNRVEFRLLEYKDLLNRFNHILKNTNVILNPIHTPMGNKGKIQKRREFLSKNSRYYFSTSNTFEGSRNLNLKSLQYAFYNGKEMVEIEKFLERYSVSRIYDIKKKK